MLDYAASIGKHEGNLTLDRGIKRRGRGGIDGSDLDWSTVNQLLPIVYQWSLELRRCPV